MAAVGLGADYPGRVRADAFAPIPAIRGVVIEPLESTRSRHRMAVPAGKFRDSIVLWRSRGNSLKRREFLSLLAGTVAPWPSFAFAQQNQAAKRIG